MKTWLANTRRSWLLVIDNADNHDIDYASFFPSGNEGSIIMTTRKPQYHDYATFECEENLDHLDLRDATLLLFKAARIEESSFEENLDAAEKVVQVLGFHTLAILQAGAFIKLRFGSLEDYSILFKEQEEQLLKYCPKQDQSTYGSVYKTFEVSATHLKSSPDQSATDALSLLHILGFVHFQDIPELIFSRAREEAIAIREDSYNGWSPDEIYNLSELQICRLPPIMMVGNGITTDSFRWRWRKALNLLESYSIIKLCVIGENLSFSIHPLAHTWTRIRLDLASRKEGWRIAGSLIVLSMRGNNYDMFHEKLRSHVEAYLKHPHFGYIGEMTELESCQTHYYICRLLSGLRDFSKLRSLLQLLETLEVWRSASGESSLRIQTLVANCYMEEGDHKTAVELLERVVKSDGSKSLSRQIYLSRAYRDGKQYQKAVDLLEQIVEIRERTEVTASTSFLRSQHELGRACMENGQLEKAIPILESVVEIRKKKLLPTHPERLISEHEVGKAYLENGQLKRAVTILESVVEVGKRILMSTHPHRLTSEHELGRAYIEGEQFGRAAELFEHVVGIREQTLALDDSSRLASQYNLARAYIGMESGHYERAAELLEQVVKMEKITLAPDDPSRLASQYYLARAYIGMGSGHYGEAAELLKQVVKMEKITSAPDDPARRRSQQWLQEVYRLIG